MARPLRLDFVGGVYHITARGNERRPIFREDLDRKTFLRRLADCRNRFGFFVYAYCLMGNHLHLALERGQVPLSIVMQTLLSLYAQWFNRRYDRVGHLFQGRYKSFLVQRDRYLLALLRYIHENPVKAGLVARSRDYVWSSDRYYRTGRGPEWLDLDRVLSLIGETRSAALAGYRECMDGVTVSRYETAPLSGRVVKGEEKYALRMIQEAEGVSPVRRVRQIGELAGAVALAEGFSTEELRSRGRGLRCSRARSLAAYLARREGGIAIARMAKYLGRDESTMIRAVQRLERALERDSGLRVRVDAIAAKLDRQEVQEVQV